MMTPSPWVMRWAPLIAPGGSVLDVACGSGRHVHALAAKGFRVVALDRDAQALAALHGTAAEILVADMESGPWPLTGRRFDAVLVTNYLHRPLFPALLDSLADGGVLIYETFGAAQASIGRPSNPEFLLRPRELLELTRGLRVVAFEDGFEAGSALVNGEQPGSQPTRFVQRIVAVREATGASQPFARYAIGERVVASG